MIERVADTTMGKVRKRGLMDAIKQSADEILRGNERERRRDEETNCY